MKIDPKRLGAAIRRVRKARGITQREVAEAVGVTVTYISLLENGQRGVSVETLNSVAAALSVPTATLTCLASNPPKKRGGEWGDLMKEFQGMIIELIEAESASLKS